MAVNSNLPSRIWWRFWDDQPPSETAKKTWFTKKLKNWESSLSGEGLGANQVPLVPFSPAMPHFWDIVGFWMAFWHDISDWNDTYEAGNLNSRLARQEICQNSGRNFLPSLPGVLLFTSFQSEMSCQNATQNPTKSQKCGTAGENGTNGTWLAPSPTADRLLTQFWPSKCFWPFPHHLNSV